MKLENELNKVGKRRNKIGNKEKVGKSPTFFRTKVVIICRGFTSRRLKEFRRQQATALRVGGFQKRAAAIRTACTKSENKKAPLSQNKEAFGFFLKNALRFSWSMSQSD